MPVIPTPRRLRQENRLNLGDRGYNESRLCPCTPVWATERDAISGKKKKVKLVGVLIVLLKLVITEVHFYFFLQVRTV